MAKKTSKKTAKKSAKKTAPARKPAPKRVKPSAKVSLKKIVAEIERALAELDKSAPRVRSIEGSEKVANARLKLKAAREAVESACTPGFEFPFE